MAKKFENILTQNEDEKITEQELNELAEKLSAEIKKEIDDARTENKRSFGYNFTKVLNENNISLSLWPRLLKKIENIIKKNNFKDPYWRVDDARTVQGGEEERAGQPYHVTDL